MHSEPLCSPAWWSQLSLKLPASVRTARPAPGVIKQKNSSVLPYTLTLDDGQEFGVVVKLVDLRANSYRDKQHRDRSTQSYKVESGFYKYFGHRMHNAKATIPDLLHEQWQQDDTGVTIVLEDLRSYTYGQASTRLTHQALALDYHQAVLALTWLSKMHAACWGVSPSGIWPKGAYWSLEKRRDDLGKISKEWDEVHSAFANTFPDIFSKSAVKELGPRLAAVAADIDQLLDIGTEPLQSLQTIIHGDFKTANLFFSPSAEVASKATESSPSSMAASVSACDFQWSGGGLAVTDVMYLLWTSVLPTVIHEHEDELLRCYHSALQQQLQHHKCDFIAYGYDQFCRHYQLAYLDYVRFLIGAMWGAVTPNSCTELAQDINQGIHKRSAQHLAHMVDKADLLLSRFEEDRLEKEQQTAFAGS